MHDVEDDLRQAFHAHAPTGEVPIEAALRAGRRTRRVRRTVIPAAALVVATAGIATMIGGHDQYQLVGDGLTLSHGPGVEQIGDDRVDMGDGIQAWRDDETLSIGYPARPYASLDTKSLTSQWGDLGHDIVVFDDPDEHDGTTMVVGTVQGQPSSVEVIIDSVSQQATVACFTQAPGWCSYKAKVPASWRSGSYPRVIVK
jgi:hypothetical protein